MIAWEQGDRERTRSLYRASLTLAWQMNNQPGIAECLEGLAAVEAPARPKQAARLLGVAAAVRGARGSSTSAQTLVYGPLSFPPLSPGPTAAAKAAARTALGETAFGAAWAEGRALPPEQAVAEALGASIGPHPCAEKQRPEHARPGQGQ